MKKGKKRVRIILIFLIILILIILIFQILEPTQLTGEAITENELVAHYKFEGNAKDSVGNNDGTIYGDIQFVKGELGQAASFNNNAYIIMGSFLTNKDIYESEAGSSTIAVWVKPEDVMRYNVITNNVGGFDYLSAGKTPKGYRNRITATIYNKATKEQDFEAYSAKPIESNVWIHIVFVLEGEKGYKFYINGKLDRHYSDSYLILTDYGDEAYIGKGFDSNSYFNGLIDDLRIYKGVLSPDEIKELYEYKIG